MVPLIDLSRTVSNLSMQQSKESFLFSDDRIIFYRVYELGGLSYHFLVVNGSINWSQQNSLKFIHAAEQRKFPLPW
jgi:hypothetical protein